MAQRRISTWRTPYPGFLYLVCGGMPSLLAKSSDLTESDTLHSSRPKSFLNIVELQWLDSSLDLFHNLLAYSEERAKARNAPTAWSPTPQFSGPLR
jgi:hypothetical protein